MKKRDWKRTSIGQSFEDFCGANSIGCDCSNGRPVTAWGHRPECIRSEALESWRQLGADLLGIPTIHSPCPTGSGMNYNPKKQSFSDDAFY